MPRRDTYVIMFSLSLSLPGDPLIIIIIMAPVTDRFIALLLLLRDNTIVYNTRPYTDTSDRFVPRKKLEFSKRLIFLFFFFLH